MVDIEQVGLPISTLHHPHITVPVQTVLHSLLVVHLMIQRAVVVQTFKECVEVQLPSTVVVITRQTGPFARRIVIDFTVGTPERHLILGTKQEGLLHILKGVRFINGRGSLLDSALQENTQLEVLLSINRETGSYVGMTEFIHHLD